MKLITEYSQYQEVIVCQSCGKFTPLWIARLNGVRQVSDMVLCTLCGGESFVMRIGRIKTTSKCWLGFIKLKSVQEFEPKSSTPQQTTLPKKPPPPPAPPPKHK